MVLRPENEQLEIHFTALNFSAPKGAQFGARFRYRLEEHAQKEREPNWTDIGTRTRGAFSPNCRRANYTFLVQACNEDGIWNETGAIAGGDRRAAVLAQAVVHRRQRAHVARGAGRDDLSHFHRQVETPVARWRSRRR